MQKDDRQEKHVDDKGQNRKTNQDPMPMDKKKKGHRIEKFLFDFAAHKQAALTQSTSQS